MSSCHVKTRKIGVLGYRGVGKSSLSNQLVDQTFSENYNPTIENTFHTTIKLKGTTYNTQILDTAGQDEFSIFHPEYSHGIQGYAIVYSVTSKASFEGAKLVNDKILNACGTENIPRVFIGNKVDLAAQRQVETQEAQAFAQQLNCLFFECSAKHNLNIAQAFQSLIALTDKEIITQQETCILL
eukprot:TRINITY_DN671_c0_g1_i4.p1 TRINITY_DN671_c0_g1~~TRINITY_DN671_c0_g1_i4.p1  ORF type:complete len:184 (-),score=64.28 TRINITY_DN671_c0_g1_i4:276-827(-)